MPATVRVQLGGALVDRGLTGLDAASTRRLMGRAARTVLRHERIAEAELSLTLLDDDAIAGLNRQYLGHDGPTDVISFPLFAAGEAPIGDIYIGFDRAVRQAAANDVAIEEELVRLAVHGTLHVLGHDHPGGEARLDSEMWRVQEEIVNAVLAS